MFISFYVKGCRALAAGVNRDRDTAAWEECSDWARG